MRDRSLTTGGFYWEYFSPGLPVFLSLLFRVFPGDPAAAARLATAAATGLVPAFPYLLWRGVQPFRVRLLVAGMLALWPGQVLFSGVVAQDNWVLLPSVALAALAVCRLSGGRAHPVAAGLLYALGVAFRQEMLIVLLPLLAAAAWERGRRGRSIALALLAAGAPLLLLALQRQAASGRFALTSEHSGLAVLGSYVPGATRNSWIDPLPYVASVEPALLRDRRELRRRALGLALSEVRRRPAFHAARITASVLDFAVASEADNLYWSVLAPEVMPPPLRPRGARLAHLASPLLRIEMMSLLALFLATLLFSWRNPAVWALGAAMACKIGLHAVTVSQGRYFLVVTALQLLAIALGAGEMAARGTWRTAAAALATGAIVAVGVGLVGPRAVGWVQRRDLPPLVLRLDDPDAPGASRKLKVAGEKR